MRMLKRTFCWENYSNNNWLQRKVVRNVKEYFDEDVYTKADHFDIEQ